MEATASVSVVRVCFKVFGARFAVDDDAGSAARRADEPVTRRVFQGAVVTSALSSFPIAAAAALDSRGLYTDSRATSVEMGVLLTLVPPAHSWWAPPHGEGLDELRVIGWHGSQALPTAEASAQRLAPPGDSPPAAGASTAASPSPPGASSSGSGGMYVLAEVWNADAHSADCSKLVQLERALWVLEAHAGAPVEACVLGVLAVGPHMGASTCAKLYAAVVANRAALPKLHALCTLQRFLGLRVEAAGGAGEAAAAAAAAVEELRTEVAALRAELRTKSAGIRTEFDGLRTSSRAEFAALAFDVADLRTELGGLRADVGRLQNTFDERFGQLMAALAAAGLAAPDAGQR